jgi:hypothetical protein
VFAVVLSLAMNAGSYFFSDKIALRAMNAQPVGEQQFPELYRILHAPADAGAHRPAAAAGEYPQLVTPVLRDTPYFGCVT